MSLIYYIDIIRVLFEYLNMPYTISEHKPADCICKCGAIIKYSSMQKHLLSAKHRRDMVGCENVTVVAHYKFGNN